MTNQDTIDENNSVVVECITHCNDRAQMIHKLHRMIPPYNWHHQISSVRPCLHFEVT